MTKSTKIILIVFGSVALVIVLAFAGLVYWLFFTHDPEGTRRFVEAGAEGRTFGQSTNREGCMKEGLERSKKIRGIAIEPNVLNKEFVEGCLKTSSPSPAFCANVPGAFAGEMNDWTEKQCDNIGRSEDFSSCKPVFDAKLYFCNH